MGVMDAHRVLFVAILILFAFPPQVHAQGVARSFEQLQLLVRTGDTVTVRDWSGAQTTGKIESLSSSTLTFVTSRGRQDLREADVAAILQRRGDSLANGAVWGLGFGLLAGGTLAALMCSDGPCDASLALGVAIYGGIGAGIGGVWTG